MGDLVRNDDPRWARYGVTARKRDYWTTRGWIRTTTAANPGSGYVRFWPAEELEIARVMVLLTAASLHPAVAERVARGDSQPVPGVRILVEETAAVAS